MVFTFFLITVSWKLTNSSLWFDETVEFYYSKIPLSNMYEKIISTSQPPLYNFILHFWLKISESEWWFRFSGVVFGFWGCVALYKTVERFSGFKAGCISVIFCSLSYNIVYYLQEAAEYSLLLGVIGWVAYFFICSLETPSKKNMIYFVIACILAMYSQYGAVFIIVSSYFVLLTYLLKKKQTKEALMLCFSGVAAGIFTGLPLLFFFLIPQMKAQGSVSGNLQRLTFDTNILYDLCMNFCKVIQWIFFGEAETTLNILVKVFLFVIVIMIALQLIKSSDNLYKISVLVFLLAFLLYYIAVKLGFYAVNSYTSEHFGNRYDLFLSLWFLFISVVTLEKSFSYCSKQEQPAWIVKTGKILLGSLIAFSIFFSWHNYNKIDSNWNKEDAREGVNIWYSVQGYEHETLVYYANEYGFKYYLEHDMRYSEEYLKYITYQPWSYGISETDFKQYLLKTYENNLPSELYFTASHISNDKNSMLHVFSNMGYAIDTLWQGNRAALYYIHY